MEILFGGVRGTTPRAESRFAIYGGHTTCLLVTGAGGERLMLDAGSGVHVANAALEAVSGLDLLVLFTHLHLDHILGLPLLTTLFDAEARVELASVSNDNEGPCRAFERLLDPPLWPIGLDALPATVTYSSVPPGKLTQTEPVLRQGNLEIRGCAVPHPNGCTGWRVDEPSTGASFVFATDMEWSAAGPKHREAFLATCRDADLLIMDGHFTAAELPDRTGWGHSSHDECVAVAQEAGVRRLLITHHAPDNDDVLLADLDRELNASWSGASLARQGDTVILNEALREGRNSL